MAHDIADATKFRHSAVFQRFEGDALAAVLEQEAIGADDVTDLVLVNLKGPDYVGHAYGPASAGDEGGAGRTRSSDGARARHHRAQSRRGRFVVAITADHGMPGEPRPGGRHYIDDLERAHRQALLPAGGTVVQYFKDAANNEIHLDTSRLRSLHVSLKDVAAFLESQGFFAAVYTEDEVRAAQSRVAPRVH